MTYIFLDIDGVLNNHKYLKKKHRQYGGKFFCENTPFNPRSLKNLKKLVDKTNGVLVLSSTWRKFKKSITILEARLAEYNLKIFDKTPYEKEYETRGDEIRGWLNDNKNILKIPEEDHILILDDEVKDIKKQYNEDLYIVEMNPKDGFTYFKLKEAIGKAKLQKRLWNS